MAKSEVYSWRIDPDLKAALQQAARDQNVSMSRLLEQIVDEWMGRRASSDDDEEQRRLHAAAARCFGTIRGSDPRRSQEVSKRVRKKLRERRRDS